MKAYSAWNKFFTKRYLREQFYTKIRHGNSVGLDKISIQKFEGDLDENIAIILRKVNNNTYKFTRYKQLLFIKGPNKPPRSISVPTVRDRLILSVLNKLITEVYGHSCTSPMPHTIIYDITSELQHYTHFIKLDIHSFYASINQEKLLRIVSRKIRKREILSLIEKAIQTASIPFPTTKKIPQMLVNAGIPEGLSVSNSLANIYLMEIDEKYSSMKNVRYWRYVDDILLFTNESTFEKIKTDILEDLKCLGLDTNDKKDEGLIHKGFTYLGYDISPKVISVKQNSILKLEPSFEDLFRQISTSTNKEYIQWKINLKITGFVIEKQKYGWVFFFSQINDLSLLFHLDKLIVKFSKRFQIDKMSFKSFVRTYFDITKSLSNLKYVPNFDSYTLDEKRNVLINIYKKDLTELSDADINLLFLKNISKEIKEIEKDVQSIS